MGIVEDVSFTTIPSAATVVFGSPHIPFANLEIVALQQHVRSGGSLVLLTQSGISKQTGSPSDRP